MIILTIFFFITVILYSSIGFGGGSTYLALMLIWDIPYYIFPIIALICNIIVVTGNSINFLRTKNVNINLLTPYLIGSVPFAFFGASISIDKNLFEILLFFILLVAGIFLLLESNSFYYDKILSPILFILKAGYPKHITSTASLFILINSIFGVAGQLTKETVLNEFLNYWPLFIAVLIGGQIGSFINIKFLSNKVLALMTSFLVIIVAIRMGLKLIS